MEVLLFLAGALAGIGGTLAVAGGVVKKKDAEREQPREEPQEIREMLQFENFMNYDGSGRGQKEL